MNQPRHGQAMNIWSQLGKPSAKKDKKAAPETPPKRPKLKPGDRVGSWTLVEYLPGTRPHVDFPDAKRLPAIWKCTCDCGTRRCVQASNIASGASKSCGCQPKLNWWQ